jgi:hypothetical protein
MGAGGEGGALSDCGAASSMTGAVGMGQTTFAVAEADLAATLLFARTGFIDSPLCLLLGTAGGAGFTASNRLGGLMGSDATLPFATATPLGASGAAGTARTVSCADRIAAVFAALCSETVFTPHAMPAPAATKSTTATNGRMDMAEELLERASLSFPMRRSFSVRGRGTGAKLLTDRGITGTACMRGSFQALGGLP